MWNHVNSTASRSSKMRRWAAAFVVSPLLIWLLSLFLQRIVPTDAVEPIGALFLNYIFFVAPLSVLLGIALFVKSRITA